MASDQCIFSQLHVCLRGSWMAVWDSALGHGSKGTCYTQALLRALSQPVLILVIEDVLSLGDDDCHCSIAENDTAIEHLCNCHAFLLMLILSLQLSSTDIRQSFSRGEHAAPSPQRLLTC